MERNFKPFKTVLFISILVSIAGFISLIGAEMVLFFSSYSPSYFHRNSAQVHKSCDFNVTYKMNDLGFRENDFDFSGSQKGLKIVMIGDSMTMGHGVQELDTIPRILENSLRKKSKGAQVVNLGLSAANPSLYLQILRFIALPMEPDVIIVNYYSGNDPQDMVPYAKQSDAYKAIRNTIDTIFPRTLSFINKRVSIFLDKDFFARRKEFVVEKCVSLKDQVLEVAKGSNDLIFLNDPDYLVAIERIKNIFLRMEEECSKRGIKFYVNIIDSFIQTRQDYWKLYAEAKMGSEWFLSHQGPYRKNHEFLDDLQNQKNFSLIKTIDEIWNYKEEPLHHEHDGHFNKTGTRLVAQIIHKRLEQDGYR